MGAGKARNATAIFTWMSNHRWRCLLLHVNSSHNFIKRKISYCLLETKRHQRNKKYYWITNNSMNNAKRVFSSTWIQRLDHLSSWYITSGILMTSHRLETSTDVVPLLTITTRAVVGLVAQNTIVTTINFNDLDFLCLGGVAGEHFWLHIWFI